MVHLNNAFLKQIIKGCSDNEVRSHQNTQPFPSDRVPVESLNQCVPGRSVFEGVCFCQAFSPSLPRETVLLFGAGHWPDNQRSASTRRAVLLALLTKGRLHASSFFIMLRKPFLKFADLSPLYRFRRAELTHQSSLLERARVARGHDQNMGSEINIFTDLFRSSKANLDLRHCLTNTGSCEDSACEDSFQVPSRFRVTLQKSTR